MYRAALVREYQESKIEHEPILGPVLAMPDGRLQPLSFVERLQLIPICVH